MNHRSSHDTTLNPEETIIGCSLLRLSGYGFVSCSRDQITKIMTLMHRTLHSQIGSTSRECRDTARESDLLCRSMGRGYISSTLRDSHTRLLRIQVSLIYIACVVEERLRRKGILLIISLIAQWEAYRHLERVMISQLLGVDTIYYSPFIAHSRHTYHWSI